MKWSELQQQVEILRKSFGTSDLEIQVEIVHDGKVLSRDDLRMVSVSFADGAKLVLANKLK